MVSGALPAPFVEYVGILVVHKMTDNEIVVLVGTNGDEIS